MTDNEATNKTTVEFNDTREDVDMSSAQKDCCAIAKQRNVDEDTSTNEIASIRNDTLVGIDHDVLKSLHEQNRTVTRQRVKDEHTPVNEIIRTEDRSEIMEYNVTSKTQNPMTKQCLTNEDAPANEIAVISSVMENSDIMSQQEQSAVARERFLRLLLNLPNRKVNFEMYENTKVSAIFEATDASFGKIMVSDLQTPIAVYNKAYIRTSDIVSFTVDMH